MEIKAASLQLARLAAIVLVCGSVAVAIASWFAFFWAPLDLANQIAPFWMLLAVIGAAATLAIPAGRERNGVRAAFALSIVALGAQIIPEFTRPIATVSSPPANAPRVRVVWLNTQSGSAPEGVSEYLVNSGADFLVLAEYHAEGGAIPADLTSAYPYFSSCSEPHDCNVVLLSRHKPVAERRELSASDNGLRMVWTDFEIDGAPLRLAGVHLQRPYPATRYEVLREELLAFLRESDEDNLILAGDFNAAPWSFALRRFDDESSLTRHDRAMPTWPAAPWTRLRLPAPEAFMPLDHVYSGSNWRLVSVRRGPRTGADHFPIEADFVWDASY